MSNVAGKGRSLSASRIFVVGLVCFGAWLIFDARELYQSANASPIGLRRTVAMTILAPVARAEETLGLDRVVNGANRVIGKSGTPGGSAFAEVVPATVDNGRGKSAGSSSRSLSGGRRRNLGSKRNSLSLTRLRPLLQPSATRPLTILEIGDSIGADLGLGLIDQLAHVKSVRLLTKSVGDTGLSNLTYYNWIAQLPVEIATYHPGVVAVMLGGNDAQAFMQGNTIAEFGTATWKRLYGQRVGQIMAEATGAGAHVLWVGLPVMGPNSGLNNSNVQLQNTIYANEAKAHPGVIYVPTWKLFENSAGQYSTYLPGIGGGLVQMRDPDETHIDPPGGTDLLGSYVVSLMESRWHIRL